MCLKFRLVSESQFHVSEVSTYTQDGGGKGSTHWNLRTDPESLGTEGVDVKTLELRTREVPTHIPPEVVRHTRTDTV